MKLVSLWEMLVNRFHPDSYFLLVSSIAETKPDTTFEGYGPPQDVKEAFDQLREECKEMGLTASCATIGKILALSEHERLGEFHKLFKEELRDRLIDEMHEQWFFALKPGHSAFYDALSLYDQAVLDRYPDTDIVYDITEAGRCIALERSTAAIFHLMRVVEHGLREFAADLDIKFDKPAMTVSKADWNQLLDGIDHAMEKIRGHTSSTDLEYYDYLYIQFNGFKNAFRNPVSHLRGKWTLDEALVAWTSVKAFMEKLAMRPQVPNVDAS